MKKRITPLIKNKHILIRVDDKQYENIEKRAKKAGVKISPYARWWLFKDEKDIL